MGEGYPGKLEVDEDFCFEGGELAGAGEDGVVVRVG